MNRFCLHLVDGVELRRCLSALTNIPFDRIPDFIDQVPKFDLITDLKCWLKRQNFSLSTDHFIHGKIPPVDNLCIFFYTDTNHETHCKVVVSIDLPEYTKNTHSNQIMVIQPVT